LQSAGRQREWRAGVKEGRFSDDFDAEREFCASRLVAGVPLPLDCAKLTDQHRTMLRSLEIPGNP
jgi:hypothetical protein